MSKHVTIIGAGHGGYAAAADLQSKGYPVTLYELPEYQRNLYPIIEFGKLKMTGAQSAIVPSHSVTFDIEQAMSKADMVLIITHAAAHTRIAEMIAPYVRDGQTILLLPGYTGSALAVERQFRRFGVRKNYMLGETNTLPYACRKIAGEPAVHIKLYVQKFLASAFPASKTPQLMSEIRPLFPNAVSADNVLETGFNNGNPVLNAVSVVLNAGRIEYARGEFYQFKEGVTSAVAGVMEQMDRERMAIAASWRIRAYPYLTRAIETGYITTTASWLEALATSPHLTSKGPDSLDTRYLTEDVPYGLAPWHHFAEQAGLSSRLITSFIHTASALLNRDFLAEGRTLEEMGIAGMSVSQLHRFLQSG